MRRSGSCSIALSVAAVLLAAGAPARAAEPVVLKIATVAPEGSSWMKQFHAFASRVEARAPDVKFKFFTAGVLGDERKVIDLVKKNQLSGAGVTAVGMSFIQPEVRILELPFLYRDDAEFEHVRAAISPTLTAKFEEKGFVFLHWADVGPVQLYSNLPVKARDDLTKIKAWAWVDDLIVRQLIKELGVNSVPLPLQGVLPALRSGDVDTCYGSPLSMVAMQWHSKVKYVSSAVISRSVGATVLSKAAWDSLSDSARAVIREEAATLEKSASSMVKEECDAAMKKMLAQGLVMVPTPPELHDLLADAGRAVAKKVEGQLYGAALHARVEKLIAEYRATHK